MDRLRLVHKDTLSCEPILRRMADGTLLLVAQCGDVTEPAPKNRVYVFHSADNGESFTAPTLIIPEDGRAVYLTEVMVLDDVVTVFLTTHNGAFLNWRVLLVTSRDCGHTWTVEGAPEHLPTFTFYRGMIRLRSGRILITYQHYDISEQENAALLRQNLKWKDSSACEAQNGVIYSDDGGKSYAPAQGPSLFFSVHGAGRWVWSEPSIVELADGRVSMLLRGNTGCLWRSDSKDGGLSWSAPCATDIPNPSNKPKLLALPDGEIALIHTPNANVGMAYRNPLAIWRSKDGMNTWYERRIVTDFPGSFCYPDGFYENGHILFSIEYNRHDILFVDHAL